MERQKRTQTTASLQGDLLRRIDEIAAAEHRSRASTIEVLLLEAVAARETRAGSTPPR